MENSLNEALSMERSRGMSPRGDLTDSTNSDLVDSDFDNELAKRRKALNKARLMKLATALVFLVALGAGGYFGYPYVKRFFEPSPEPPKMTLEQLRREQAAEAAKTGQKPTRDQTAQIPERQATPPQSFEKPAPRYYNSTGNLGTLSQQRGQRLLLEQSVKIAELEKRLDELKNPPEIQMPPQPLQLPQVVQPTPPPEIDLPKLQEPESSSSKPTVVSIQGSGGNLSATFLTAQGKYVTVKNGGSYNGGIVLVSKNGVQLRKNGKTQTIPFE